jgi:putative FmdB family regulatory protein
MPRYDYECPNCGVFDRVVGYDDRDDQCCYCGSKLRRMPHFSSVNIDIPLAFMATTGQSIGMPRNAEERKRWDEDGVKPAARCDF